MQYCQRTLTSTLVIRGLSCISKISHVFETPTNETHISLGDIQKAPTRWVLHGTFCGVSKLLVCCAKLLFRGGGGGGMCILFEICEKMLFQKCMGWGGGVGGHISEHRAETWTMHGTEHCTGDHRLFRI